MTQDEINASQAAVDAARQVLTDAETKLAADQAQYAAELEAEKKAANLSALSQMESIAAQIGADVHAEVSAIGARLRSMWGA